MGLFSDLEISTLIKNIYYKNISVFNLPFNVFRKTAEKYLTGIDIGYGLDNEKTDPNLIRAFKHNVNLFAGAKTFNYVLASEGLLYDDKNQLIPFNKFKELAKPLFDKYNKHWLEAEYNTCVGQAQQARGWENYLRQEHDFPLIEYVANLDDLTSPICASKDGIIRPVRDSFWATNSPLSHYRCRCTLIQHGYGEAEISHDITKVVPAEGIFAQNPAFTGQIFDKSHPYFNIEGSFKAYAKKNFNLPIIE